MQEDKNTLVEFHDLFDEALWTTEKILKHFGPKAKIYTKEKMLKALYISKLDYGIFNYHYHQNDLYKALDRAEYFEFLLREELSDEKVKGFFRLKKHLAFDTFKYLDDSSICIQKYLDQKGLGAICFPQESKLEIGCCFKEYHTYTFLRHYEKEMDDKALSVRQAELEPYFLYCQIHNKLDWGLHDPLYVTMGIL